VGLDEIGMQVDLMGAGPIARHPADLEVALSALAGPDEEDGQAWQLQLPPPRFDHLRAVRVAVWADDADFPVSAAVRDAIVACGEQLAAAGATVRWDHRPAFRLAEAERVAFALWVASTTVSTDGMTSFLDQAGGLAPGDDSLPARRLRSETMLHHDWALLDAERRRMAREWASMFDHVDALICPVSPVIAVTHDPDPTQVADLERRLHRRIDVDGRSRPYLDQMTWNIVVGMAGLPSTVVPLGADSAGLPVGAQVVAPRFADRTTIRLAAALADAGVGGYRRPPEGTGGS
jgi:amidase